MVLKVLGSSSKGNSYLLDGEYESLVLEAGINFSKVQEAVGFNTSKIRGVCITHEHL
jgi:metal-dependent hydrolase (beta-lactamase superfamily II)